MRPAPHLCRTHCRCPAAAPATPRPQLRWLRWKLPRCACCAPSLRKRAPPPTLAWCAAAAVPGLLCRGCRALPRAFAGLWRTQRTTGGAGAAACRLGAHACETWRLPRHVASRSRATSPRCACPQVNAKLGPGAGAALALLLYVYLLLSCTAYLMIAADCLCPLLAGAAGPEAWWVGRQAVVAAVGLGVALPLSLPRTLGAVAGELAGGWEVVAALSSSSLCPGTAVERQQRAARSSPDPCAAQRSASAVPRHCFPASSPPSLPRACRREQVQSVRHSICGGGRGVARGGRGGRPRLLLGSRPCLHPRPGIP